jgi:hypothetical protein
LGVSRLLVWFYWWLIKLLLCVQFWADLSLLENCPVGVGPASGSKAGTLPGRPWRCPGSDAADRRGHVGEDHDLRVRGVNYFSVQGMHLVSAPFRARDLLRSARAMLPGRACGWPEQATQGDALWAGQRRLDWGWDRSQFWAALVCEAG